MGKASPKPSLPHRVRIIAGLWRGRYIQVPPHPAVRPTPARVRETVFNWLSKEIEAAVCLDLYAGSGALGFEAASRGARHVTLVEKDRAIIRCLRAQALKLDARQIRVVPASALTYLDTSCKPADIVFLDPPHAAGSQHIETLYAKLIASKTLKASSLIYLESPTDWDPRHLSRWTLLKSKKAGQVGYHLFAAQA